MARAELKTIISADARAFQKTMAKVRKRVGQVGKNLLRAGAVGAGGLAVLTKKAVAYGDGVDKAAKRTGISAESIQKLEFAAKIGGGELGDIEKAVKRMSSAIGDADNGLLEAVRDFDALGVSMKDLKGKTPDEQLMTLLKALGDVSDATKRQEIAQGLFGRSGTNLLPIVAAGSAAMEEQFKKVEDLGGILSNDAVSGAAALTDAITELTTSARGFAFGAILENAGKMQDVVDALTAKMAQLREEGKMREMADNFASILQVAGFLAKVAIGFVTIFAKIGEAINTYIIQPIDKITDSIIGKLGGNLIQKALGEAATDTDVGFARSQIGFEARERQIALQGGGPAPTNGPTPASIQEMVKLLRLNAEANMSTATQLQGPT